MYYLVSGRILVKEKDTDGFEFKYVDKIARITQADNPAYAASQALNDYLIEGRCTGVWVGYPDVSEISERRLEQMRAVGIQI